MGSSEEKQIEDPFITLIDQYSDPVEECKTLRKFKQQCMKFPVIGLDAEWTMTDMPPYNQSESHGSQLPVAARVRQIRNPVSVLQLANKNGHALIIRLKQVNSLKDESSAWRIFYEELKDLLNSAEILKVGVSIQTDTSNLYYDYGLYTVNCLDLQHIAAFLNYPKTNLAYLSKKLCNYNLQKFLAKGDWDQATLSAQLLKYAADDARLGVLIFEKFMQQCIQESKHEPRPVKNCADFINRWRYKIDVIYRHHQRFPDNNPNRINKKPKENNLGASNNANLSTKLGAVYQQVLQDNSVFGKMEKKRPYRLPFCLWILIFFLILLSAVVLLFHLVQKANYSF